MDEIWFSRQSNNLTFLPLGAFNWTISKSSFCFLALASWCFLVGVLFLDGGEAFPLLSFTFFRFFLQPLVHLLLRLFPHFRSITPGIDSGGSRTVGERGNDHVRGTSIFVAHNRFVPVQSDTAH